MLIIDTSGSMDMPSSKIRRRPPCGQGRRRRGARRHVVRRRVGQHDGHDVLPGHRRGWCAWTPPTAAAAKQAIDDLRPGGATAIGTWLMSATELFKLTPATQRHAILLTDGKIEGEEPSVLRNALQWAHGQFQCDCRGVGSDWRVDELREIATALLGTVDIVAQPEDLEADFEAMMHEAMGRGVAQHALRLWAPQGSEVQFVRQVAPEVLDLTSTATRVSDLIIEVPTGAWGDETRDYHVAVKVPTAPVGSERLAARAEVVVGDQVVAKGARAGGVDRRRQPDDAHRSRRRPLHRPDTPRRGDPGRVWRRGPAGTTTKRRGCSARRRSWRRSPATSRRPACSRRWSTSSTPRRARCDCARTSPRPTRWRSTRGRRRRPGSVGSQAPLT